MSNHKGLKIAIGVSVIIIGAILYMFSTFLVNKNEVIYFVSKTNSENSTFWHSVERGVKVATDELGIELIFVGPEREVDLAHQIELVEQGIELEPTAIILAASDYTALADISQEVMDQGITFLTVDSDVAIDSSHSFIATDNVEASRLLGKKMAELINEEGLVGIISHLEGTTSSMDREEGFRQGVGAYNQIQLIDEIPYSNNDAEEAYRATEALVHKYPKIKGIFGTNEATLIGIAKAVDTMGLGEQITVVGFDISEAAAGYLERDIIQAIIVQRPFNMGYLSVKEAYKQAKSGKLFAFIDVIEFVDVDVVLVTKDNMFEEENQKFIIPFLE